jgi:ribonuclease HII
MSMKFERKTSLRCLIGLDECGRGAIAGPLTVCAAWVPQEHYEEVLTWGFKDSKQLTPRKRATLFQKVQDNPDKIKYSISHWEPYTVDRLGMPTVLTRAFRTVYYTLTTENSIEDEEVELVMDGLFTLNTVSSIACQYALVKADSLVPTVAIASVIGKHVRDSLMDVQHQIYPSYNWAQNKGYATEEQVLQLFRTGPAAGYHRMTCLPNTMKNFVAKNSELLISNKLRNMVPRWVKDVEGANRKLF